MSRCYGAKLRAAQPFRPSPASGRRTGDKGVWVRATLAITLTLALPLAGEGPVSANCRPPRHILATWMSRWRSIGLLISESNALPINELNRLIDSKPITKR